jgi:hypothetical protein
MCGILDKSSAWLVLVLAMASSSDVVFLPEGVVSG